MIINIIVIVLIFLDKILNNKKMMKNKIVNRL